MLRMICPEGDLSAHEQVSADDVDEGEGEGHGDAETQ